MSVEINENGRPKLTKNGKEIDCEGSFILPGFVDMHGHIGGRSQGAEPDYVFKLWMAHGITTIRQPSGMGTDRILKLKKQSQKNEIIAPRIFAYTGFNSRVSSPEEARQWVRDNAKKGADGIKFFGAPPEIMQAALEENKKLGLKSACHHAQLDVVKWNVLNSARAGLTTMEHWYGLPEALFEDRVIQNYPPDYNYNNEQHRFEEAGIIYIAVYDDAEDFDSGDDSREIMAYNIIEPVSKEIYQKKITLKEGYYAVKVLIDTNNNGDIDLNFFGLPKEQFGFSNNVLGLFGAPKFDKASFKLDENKEIIIKLR